MAADSQRFRCDDWADFRHQVAHYAHTDELGYALITERGDGTRTDSALGRVNFYDHPAGDVDVMFALTDGDEQPEQHQDPVQRFLNECLVTITDNFKGIPKMRVRIKLMGHKGNAHLKSRTLLFEDTEWENAQLVQAPMPGVGPESTSLGTLQQAGEVRQRLDSIDFSRRGQEMLLTSIHNVLAMHREGHKTFADTSVKTLDQLRAENDALRIQNGQLVRHIEEMATSRDREATERLRADANAKAIERTVDKSISILGDALELGIAAKAGIDPAVMKVLNEMNKDPEFMAVLRDPRMPEFMADPEVREFVATMMKTSMDQLEAQAKQEAQATAVAQPEAPPPAPAGDAADPKSAEAQPAPEPQDAQAEPGASHHPIPAMPDDFMESTDV